jgi:ketosteroid isomerase-like protein
LQRHGEFGAIYDSAKLAAFASQFIAWAAQKVHVSIKIREPIDIAARSSNNIDATFDSRLDGAMKTRLLLRPSCIALLSIAFVVAAAAADTTSAIEQAIRDLDDQWSKAAGAKDVDKTISFYSGDALVMPPNAPSATTKEAIRKIWKDLLTDANISWKTKKVEVAQSGDLAFSSGTYEVTLNDPTGTPVSDRGKYLEVWKKQSDGSWKCVADAWNSDLPAAPTSTEKK